MERLPFQIPYQLFVLPHSFFHYTIQMKMLINLDIVKLCWFEDNSFVKIAHTYSF